MSAENSAQALAAAGFLVFGIGVLGGLDAVAGAGAIVAGVSSMAAYLRKD